MEEELSARFDKLEGAFNELIDSITTFNPSVKAAEDVLAADDELSTGLERLVQHQRNHTRLVQLRQTADRLDAQIKDTITKLADARNELLASPWTELSPAPRKVPMHELLAYAKRISKFSLPSNFRGPPPPAKEATTAVAADTEDVAMTNGIGGTTPAGDHLPNSTTGITPTDARNDPDAATDDHGAMWSTLPENTRLWLDQMKDASFVPWPSHELIRGGALGDIQEQLERGEDPWAKQTAAQAAEAERRKRDSEAREDEAEAKEKWERERWARENVSVGTAVGSSRISGPALTGIGMFADDDEE